jgi:hypothetical protein
MSLPAGFVDFRLTMSNSDTTQRSPALIPAQAGIQSQANVHVALGPRFRGDERMLRNSPPFFFSSLQTAIHTTPFRCAAHLPRFSSLSSARPDEGVGAAPRWRIQRSRLRGASDHAYEACIAPIPNRCARLPALRLAVSAAGAALPWSPATATGPVLCPPLLLRDKALGVVPRRVVISRGRHHEPPPAATFHRGSQRTPSSLRLQESPLERAPS